MRDRNALSRRIPILAAFAVFAGLAVPASFARTEPAETERSRAAVERHTQTLKDALAAKGLSLGDPVHLEITKQPARLTAYVRSDDERFVAFRSWPICRFSGGLGTKHREGDMRAPEGIYRVGPEAMNPWSSFHLSFNLGYPNAVDRFHDRTGSALMVHGDCVSAGCYAMTDPAIEEIWTLMVAAFEGGQRQVPVHIFPFEMTDAALEQHGGHRDFEIWADLAPVWQAFHETGEVPDVRMVAGRYRLAHQ